MAAEKKAVLQTFAKFCAGSALTRSRYFSPSASVSSSKRIPHSHRSRKPGDSLARCCRHRSDSGYGSSFQSYLDRRRHDFHLRLLPRDRPLSQRDQWYHWECGHVAWKYPRDNVHRCHRWTKTLCVTIRCTVSVVIRDDAEAGYCKCCRDSVVVTFCRMSSMVAAASSTKCRQNLRAQKSSFRTWGACARSESPRWVRSGCVY